MIQLDKGGQMEMVKDTQTGDGVSSGDVFAEMGRGGLDA